MKQRYERMREKDIGNKDRDSPECWYAGQCLTISSLLKTQGLIEALASFSGTHFSVCVCVCVCVCVLATHSRLTLCDLLKGNLPGSSVCWILQARILEWVASHFSRGSS